MVSEQNEVSLLEFNEVHRKLQSAGLSDARLTVAAMSVLLGARKVLAIHGASPEVLQVVFKAEAGKTPRTVADLESAKIGKELIRRIFLDSRINEEETGDEEATLGSQEAFHFDPLDGTSSYARELRSSTVGNGLYLADQPFASAICHPFEKELVVARVRKGTHLFRFDESLENLTYVRQLEVSKNKLDGGVAFIDALFNEKTSPRKLGMMADLVIMANNNLGFRMSGSNIDQQLKVAAGRAEMTLTDAVGGFFDLAAGGLAITEAGGKFTDHEGNSVNEQTQVAIGTNGRVHDDILELAQKWYRNYQGFK